MRTRRIARCPSMLLAVVVVALGLVASPATGAAPVPGATYVGTTSEYSAGTEPWNPAWDGTVLFTVSADGTSVTSVVLRYVKDWAADGSYYGYWSQVTGGSAPIVNGAFQVAVSAGGNVDYTGSYFKGSFTGPQSAAGTLYVRESHQVTIFRGGPITYTETTASHVLTWTATVQPIAGGPPPSPPELPVTKHQCQEDWRIYQTGEGNQIFKNQGDCVSDVVTRRKNLPDG